MKEVAQAKIPKSKKQEKLLKDYDIAYDFATKAYKKFREVVKSIVLFGSLPKKEITLNSDIDIIIIIDDATINWDEELIAWYREELAKLIATQKYAKELHINTITLTTFWEELREGEPLVINVIRYGQALIDIGGFFDPLKVLLAKGRIKPSPEAIFVTMERASAHHNRGVNNMLLCVESFYWAMVDAAHAALMAKRIVPPSPEHISELLHQVFIKTDMINKKYLTWYEETRKIAKEISYGNTKKIKGEHLQELQEHTEQFVNTFRDLTKLLIKDEKIIRPEYKQL